MPSLPLLSALALEAALPLCVTAYLSRSSYHTHTEMIYSSISFHLQPERAFSLLCVSASVRYSTSVLFRWMDDWMQGWLPGGIRTVTMHSMNLWLRDHNKISQSSSCKGPQKLSGGFEKQTVAHWSKKLHFDNCVCARACVSMCISLCMKRKNAYHIRPLFH